MKNLLDKQKSNDRGAGKDWIQSTSLFSHWNAMKEQILLHKWYESEKAGHDIGWDKAAANWMIHHRSSFSASASDCSDS